MKSPTSSSHIQASSKQLNGKKAFGSNKALQMSSLSKNLNQRSSIDEQEPSARNTLKKSNSNAPVNMMKSPKNSTNINQADRDLAESGLLKSQKSNSRKPDISKNQKPQLKKTDSKKQIKKQAPTVNSTPSVKKLSIMTKPQTAKGTVEPIKKQNLAAMQSFKSPRNNLKISNKFTKNTKLTDSTKQNKQSTKVNQVKFDQSSDQAQQTFVSKGSVTLQAEANKKENQAKAEKQAFEKQILDLKRENESLQRKLQKFKENRKNDENRTLLKNQINEFNEESQQKKALKTRIEQVQTENKKLQEQNKSLLNKVQVKQTKSEKSIQQPTSLNNTRAKLKISKTQQNELNIQPSILQQQTNTQSDKVTFTKCQQESSVSLKNQDSSLSSIQCINNNSNNSNNVLITNILEIQAIKTSFQEKYEQKIKMIQSIYNENLKDLTERYQLQQRQTQNIIKEQDNEISTLQNTIDDLYDKVQALKETQNKKANSDCQTLMSIEMNQQDLLNQQRINQFKQKLNEKTTEIKKLKEDLRQRQLKAKALQTEIDMERIRHSMNGKLTPLKNQTQMLKQKEQLALLKEQLKLQRQKSLKINHLSVKKDELISKLSENVRANKNSNKNIDYSKGSQKTVIIFNQDNDSTSSQVQINKKKKYQGKK